MPAARPSTSPAGTPLVNSPQVKLFNAPSALVQVQGEFVAAVEVTNDFDPGGQTVSTPGGRRFPFTFQGAGLLLWQDEKNFIRLERCKGSDGGVGLIHRVLVEIYKEGREVGLYYSKPIPEKPVVLAARRKGTTVQLLFGEPPASMTIFRELALDFNPSILVGRLGLEPLAPAVHGQVRQVHPARARRPGGRGQAGVDDPPGEHRARPPQRRLAGAGRGLAQGPQVDGCRRPRPRA